jgi:pilus assembly protein CpaB
MPKRRLSIRSMFYVAVGVALLATFGAYRALQATRTGGVDTSRRVVIAAADIREGATITGDMVKVSGVAASAANATAFTSVDSVVGRVTRVAVFAGDVIVPGRLAPQGSGPGLEVKIGAGMRAMAVKVDDVAGLSGLIQPGSHVDVLVTIRPENSSDRQVAKVFMENVRVLSVGAVVQRDNTGKAIDATTAALEVEPAQAERLAVAMHQGTIQLVLRGYGDPERVTTAGASSGDVLAQLRSAPTADAHVVAPAVPRTRGRTSAQRQPAPVERQKPPAVAAVVSEPVAAPRSDTSVVRVYRGSGDMTEKKFVKTDTVKRKPPAGA